MRVDAEKKPNTLSPITSKKKKFGEKSKAPNYAAAASRKLSSLGDSLKKNREGKVDNVYAKRKLNFMNSVKSEDVKKYGSKELAFAAMRRQNARNRTADASTAKK